MRFKSNLKLLRLNALRSQEEVAKAIHVSRSTYAKYENGTRTPDIDTICRLSEYYNVRPDFMFQMETGKLISVLNMYSIASNDWVRIFDIYRSLSAYGQGRLLERAEALLEEEMKNMEHQNEMSAKTPQDTDGRSDDEIIKEFLISRGIYDESLF